MACSQQDTAAAAQRTPCQGGQQGPGLPSPGASNKTAGHHGQVLAAHQLPPTHGPQERCSPSHALRPLGRLSRSGRWICHTSASRSSAYT
eukprot:186659-Chlamydomonas_euryale.AAC.4